MSAKAVHLERNSQPAWGEPAGVAPVRALVADDAASMRLLLRRLLADAGIEVAVAASGEQALTLARSWDPDVVLLDWLMPTGGLELIRRMVAEHELAGRVIMLSALSDPRDRLAALEAGAASYFTKPPCAGQLVEAVCRIGRRRAWMLTI
jgi:DNA-binding response OmpR family regulator